MDGKERSCREEGCAEEESLVGPLGQQPTVDGAREESHFAVLLAIKVNKMLHRAADLWIRRHFYGSQRRYERGDH